MVLYESGAVSGVDVRGSVPGTRKIDLLRTGNLVSEGHVVLLSGSSAFGLDAVSGVVATNTCTWLNREQANKMT